MRSDHFRRGALANLVVAASVAAYGSVLGLLAAQKGISWQTLLAMNLTIFAGSAQFVMVEMWLPPLPVLEMILAAAVINLRYLFIGASLQPLFHGKRLGHKMAVMHLVADENWAVTMAAWRRGEASSAYLLGGGVCLIAAWSLGTLAGHAASAALISPEALALDFAFTAVFSAIAAGLWRGRGDLLPWLVSAGAALAASSLIGGKWYIVIGGVAGAVAGACGPGERAAP